MKNGGGVRRLQPLPADPRSGRSPARRLLGRTVRAVAMSTVDDLDPGSDREIRRRRTRYTTTTAVLTVLMVLGVADVLGWIPAYGVSEDTVRAAGGGYELAVRYGRVSRPALATPFEITVTRAGGFGGPVTLAVDQRYLELWDENGLVPAPSAERSRGDWVVWEFDPPDGETLTVWYDARIEPAAQSGRDGAVAVLEDDEAVVAVTFATRVMP